MTDKERVDRVRQTMEHIVRNNATLSNMFKTTCPAYRCYCHRGNKDRYFWTTEPVNHNGKKRYASGIYRYIKTRNIYKLQKESYHAKRKDAKARALKLWEDKS